MKTKHSISMLAVLLGLLLPSLLFAQIDLAGVPKEIAEQPLSEWQLNLTTLALGAMILGRVFKSIRQGGGLRGMWRGLVYGENIPDEVAPAKRPKSPPSGVASLAFACVLALATVPMFSGCSSVPTDPNATPEEIAAAREQQIQRISAAVSGAVQIGIVADIAKNPDHRSYYNAAAEAILIATNEGTFEFGSIVALVKAQTKDDYDPAAESTLVLGLGLYQSFYAANVSSALDTRPALKSALLAVAKTIKAVSSPVEASAVASEPVPLRIPDDLVLR